MRTNALNVDGKETQRRALRGTLTDALEIYAADHHHNFVRARVVADYEFVVNTVVLGAFAVGIFCLLAGMISGTLFDRGVWTMALVFGCALVVAGSEFIDIPERFASKRMGQPRRINVAVAADSLAAWAAALPPVTLEGKRALTETVLAGDVDLEDVHAWIEDEVERLECARVDEAHRLSSEPIIRAIERGPVAFVHAQEHVA